jgi:hypothetical protein
MNHNREGHNLLYMGGNASWHSVRNWEAVAPENGSESGMPDQNVYTTSKGGYGGHDSAAPDNWSRSDSLMF